MHLCRYVSGIIMVLLAAGPAAAQVVIGTTGDMNAAPLKWTGKLQGEVPDGRALFCTAQFIAPRVLLTAAHCVKDLDQNRYYSHYVFFLQYQSGSWTHKYYGLCWSVPAAYSLPPDYDSLDQGQKLIARHTAEQYDYAMILVDSPSATGYFSAWDGDWKPGQWHGATKIGYPRDVAAGQVMQLAHGAIIFANDIPLLPGPLFQRLLALWQDNPYLTEGTSGGGWIGNFSTTEGRDNNVLLSVSSFYRSGHPEMAFGPQFDRTVFRSMLDHVASGGCLGQ